MGDLTLPQPTLVLQSLTYYIIPRQNCYHIKLWIQIIYLLRPNLSMIFLWG